MMETIFPQDNGYQGFFLVGHRKDPGGSQLQRAGAFMLKRTYDITPDNTPSVGDPITGFLTPSSSPRPIYMKDQPEVIIKNGDFSAELDDWHAGTGVTLARAEEPAGSGQFSLQVSGNANGRVTQTITFPKPLAGRRFRLAFDVKGDAAANFSGVQLEAGSKTICAVSDAAGTDWKNYAREQEWPADTSGASFTVVLRMATDAARKLSYDNVTVKALLFEDDLAPYKPQGDPVVVANVAPGPTALHVNGSLWLNAASAVEAFAWEPRDTGSRLADAGTLPSTPPLPDPLPADFNNRFFNGYRRSARAAPLTSLPLIPTAAGVVLERSAGNFYRFKLGNEAISAHYEYYRGTGADKDTRWLTHNLSVRLDTLVIEPDNNRCYLVWRGAWPMDDQPEDVYRRLVVAASG